MQDQVSETDSTPRGRKRYDARRVRKLICMKSRLEAAEAEISAFRAEVDRTDTLLAVVGDRYAAGQAGGRDDDAMARWADAALPAYRQLVIVLSHVNDLLAKAAAGSPKA